MATPAIGGVVSSATGTVSLTAVPVGGWMLATLIGDSTPPATPSGWTSLATGSAWRIVGRIKAAESSLSVPGTANDLISVMWGTGSAAASSWRAGAVGTEGSTSVSLTGTTAGSLLVGAEPIQETWLAGQVFDAAVLRVKAVDFFLESLHLKLVVALFEIATRHSLLKILKLLDLSSDGRNVCQHTADPSFGDVWLTGRFSSCFDSFFHLLLGADEQHFFALSSDFCNFRKYCFECFDSLCQVDDVRILTLRVNVFGHFWVPTARFVSEMNTSFEQSFDINLYGHDILLPSRAHL